MGSCTVAIKAALRGNGRQRLRSRRGSNGELGRRGIADSECGRFRLSPTVAPDLGLAPVRCRAYHGAASDDPAKQQCASAQDGCWHGAECTSKEDGYLYRVRADRVICRVVEGMEVGTIDSIPLKLPAGAHVLTGVNWGFRMPIGLFYQEIIGRSGGKK